ncbi:MULTISPECIES: LysR family transcriptional regulator [unclassified Achromobacter]|uniref:LysR family transcriptional regulator n=1 Tax=unclassified Achromobacter TaxID=2626865 RepID=UPI000B51BA90|nr:MULTISPECIES: LysR family transcriptional regulator [unclassified Achromobacter]OWT70286.1 LysR family transcriptional regulator [Achromobacter sp. HZ34]OWT71826.1 LysR family transcriptional regulator [Achromobacter sp. HZ28]
MINLRHIEVFYAIMHTGSITGAARSLNVTQPAVSAVLKHLEARLGMALFVRSHGRLTPTPEAQALLPDVAAIFERLSAVERLSQDLAGGLKGTLSVAATSPIANGFLARAVATFSRERPGVRIALQALSSPLVVERVMQSEVDLGIVYQPIDNAAVDASILTSASIACVLPDTHPLAAQASISISDLAGTPVITYMPQALLRPYVDRACRQAGCQLEISVETGLSVTGIMLAYHGAGVALVEPDLLSAMPLPGLVSRPLAPAIQLQSVLLKHKHRPVSRIMDEFIAHLRAMLADGEPSDGEPSRTAT